MQRPAFGIYLNKETCKVVRANSPSAIPSGEQWVLVTPEVNATIVSVRALVREKGLVANSDSVMWD